MRRARLGPAVAVAGLALAAAGCSSAGPAKPVHQAAAATVQDGPLSMVTSMQTTGATWAAIPMGATAGPNEFWQLFDRQAGSSRWALHTPPDVATNGALVLAGTGATLTAGIRPSIDLTFSPVARTSNQGASWATSPPQTGLASHPDALAAAPDGELIAAGQNGQVSVLASQGAAWAALTSKQALSTTAGCGLISIVAVAYTPAGDPLVAGTCRQPGTAGVLMKSASGWRQVGPSMPAAGQPVQVLRLTRISTGDVAVILAGKTLFAAWSGDGRHWSLSGGLPVASAPASVSYGVENQLAVVLADGRAETVTGPGTAWQALPILPTGHAVAVTLPPGGPAETLAADGGTLTVWQLAGSRWAKTQTIKVPIQYGSSSGS